MFKTLFPFFFTSKKKRRTRKPAKLRRYKKTLKMRGGWGGAEPIILDKKSNLLMKGGWGEPVV